MIRDELKRMLAVSTIMVRPWLFFTLHIIFAIFVGLTILGSMISSTEHDKPIAVLGGFSMLLGSWMVGMSGLSLLMIARPLCLPSVIEKLIARTFVFTLLIFSIPFIVLSAFTDHHIIWTALVLLCINAGVMAWLTLPFWFSTGMLCLPTVFNSLHLHPLESISLSYSDPYSTGYLMMAAGLLYAISWRRFNRIMRKPTTSMTWNGSMIEAISRGSSGWLSDQQRPSYYYAGTPRIFLPRLSHQPTAAVDKMRLLMGDQFSKYNWSSNNFALLIAIFIGTLIFLDFTSTLISIVPAFAAFQTAMFIIELPRKDLVMLLRSQSNDLAELALLPRLSQQQSSFSLLCRAVGRPAIQSTGVAVVLVASVTMLLVPPSCAIVLMFLLSGLFAIFFQWLLVLFMFRHAKGSHPTDARLQWQTLLWVCAVGTVFWTLLACIHYVFDNGQTVTALLANFTILLILSTGFLTLGYRWYQHLKALPHPFVEIDV